MCFLAYLQEACGSVSHAHVAILQHVHKDLRAANALQRAPVLHNATHQQEKESQPQILQAGEPGSL